MSGYGDGSIYFEDSRQRWVGAISTPSGRRRVTGPTRASVRDKLRDLTKKKATATNGNLTVGAYLDDWLARTLPSKPRVRSVNTVDNYTWAIEKHLKPALGGKRLAKLTADDVENMLQARADAGMARNSLMRIRSVLVRALRDAERRNKVDGNVAALVDTPGVPQKEARALTAEQGKKLLDVIRGDRLEALYVTGLMLGLRPGELLGLSWADVDLDAATVQIRQSLKRERGQLRIGDPKTPKSRRALDVPAPVIDALRAHRARQAQDRLAAGPDWTDSGLAFATTTGGPLDPSNVRRGFARLTKKAGLGRWHPNELRHSAASLLSAAGVPLENIADVLGHDGTRMTALVYRHAVAPTVAAAVAPMEALFGAG